MTRQLLTAVTVVALVLGCKEIALAIDCPLAPEQTSNDYSGAIDVTIAKFKRLTGGKLGIEAKRDANDLLGKLPGADRVYLEQMLFHTYCSGVRDDKALSENRKAELIKDYAGEVRKVPAQHDSSENRPTSAASPSEQPKEDKRTGTKAGPSSNRRSPAKPKKKEEQQQAHLAPQKPNISQHSEGTNSPNIVGDRNLVIVNPTNDAKLDEIRDLLTQRGYPYDPQKLLQKYPLGYVIFEIDYKSEVIPYKSLSLLKQYDIAWNTAAIIQNTKDQITLRLPDIKRTDGTLGFTNAVTGGWKKVGPLGCVGMGTDTEDLTVCGEILAIRNNGIVFLVKLIQLTRPRP